jgi:hemerythrin-like domain-containing protein
MEIEEAPNGSRKKKLDHLKEEIIPHIRGEEKAFYPRLLEKSGSKEDAQEAMDEHKEAESTLKELEGIASDSHEWMTTYKQLKEQITHHVEDEESKIFDDARNVLSEDDIPEIMRQFKREKQRTKTTVKV